MTKENEKSSLYSKIVTLLQAAQYEVKIPLNGKRYGINNQESTNQPINKKNREPVF